MLGVDDGTICSMTQLGMSSIRFSFVCYANKCLVPSISFGRKHSIFSEKNTDAHAAFILIHS
jgi:hypothetical protein